MVHHQISILQGYPKSPEKTGDRASIRTINLSQSIQGEPVQLLPLRLGEVGSAVPSGSGFAFHRPYPISASRSDGSCASAVKPNRSSIESSAPDATGTSTRRCWNSPISWMPHPVSDAKPTRYAKRTRARCLVIFMPEYTQPNPGRIQRGLNYNGSLGISGPAL